MSLKERYKVKRLRLDEYQHQAYAICDMVDVFF